MTRCLCQSHGLRCPIRAQRQAIMPSLPTLRLRNQRQPETRASSHQRRRAQRLWTRMTRQTQRPSLHYIHSKEEPRLLLDVFSGIHSPISQAAMEMGLDRFEPFDIMINPEHDILNNDVFHSLLKICWSGIVGLITLAPPCKEYSRLKLRPGRPPAVRTPDHMQGV